MNTIGGNGFGALSEAAGTRIQRLVPPRPGAYTRLMKLVYTAGATEHLITVLRPLGVTKLTQAAGANQKVIHVAADPGPSGNGMAAGDYMAVQSDDGVTRLYKIDIAGVTGLAVTFTENLVAAASAGRPVWFFGVPADTDPATGEAHPAFNAPSDATTTYASEGASDAAGIVAGFKTGDPLMIDVDNPTNAGVLEQTSYKWTGQ